MNDSSDLAIIRAVQRLDEKMSQALSQQTATLTASIRELADRHHESQLEQERRNATFADRDRVEKIAQYGHDNAGAIQTLTGRLSNTEKRIVELDTLLREFQQSIGDRAVGLLAGANGYLLTFITLVVVAIVAAVIARAIR